MDYGLWASCAHHRLRSAVLHDTNMGAHPLRYYAVGCLTTSRHKAVCRVYYRNRNRNRSVYYLGEAASDLHVLSSFHSLNALPMTMYIHYTSDSLSVARLSLAYWQNMSDMCYQVESGIICSQNGQLSKQWTIAKN